MSRRRTPTRYVSSSYSRSALAARRAGQRRRARRRRLLGLTAAVLLLCAGTATAWALIVRSDDGAVAGGGQQPQDDMAAAVEPSKSASSPGPASPAADTRPSPAAQSTAPPSPDPSSPAASPTGAGDDQGDAGIFTGKYVPILMYHRIEETGDTSSNAKYYTSPRKFRQQMRALYLNGYTAVTLQQVWDYWHGKGTLPAKPIVLSFDDGTSGQVENTLPVLEKYGWPGVISVVVPNISDGGGPLSITPAQIRRLLAAGWELDSHSMTHPMLTTVSADRLAYEVGESRRRLQRMFGVPCNFFCYPGGDYNEAVIAAVKAAGYLGATTVVRGCADPATPYALDRIEVDGRNVIKTFLRDLRYWEEHP